MTLRRFQTLTSQVPTQIVRRAMAVALAAEAPRTAGSYVRFYCRVLRELGLALASECRSRRKTESAPA